MRRCSFIDVVGQEYAAAHCCIIDAIAGDGPLQQVSWYACTPAGNDRAMIALACTLGEGCLSMRVNDEGSSFYGDAFLMSPAQAAGHICIELSDHVTQNVIFLVCMSPIMQVPCDVRRVACDVLLLFYDVSAVEDGVI